MRTLPWKWSEGCGGETKSGTNAMPCVHVGALCVRCLGVGRAASNQITPSRSIRYPINVRVICGSNSKVLVCVSRLLKVMCGRTSRTLAFQLEQRKEAKAKAKAEAKAAAKAAAKAEAKAAANHRSINACLAGPVMAPTFCRGNVCPRSSKTQSNAVVQRYLFFFSSHDTIHRHGWGRLGGSETSQGRFRSNPST